VTAVDRVAQDKNRDDEEAAADVVSTDWTTWARFASGRWMVVAFIYLTPHTPTYRQNTRVARAGGGRHRHVHVYVSQ